MEVYGRLLAEHGPRGWWPADSPFEVIIGAILVQNTGWRNVPPALDRMKRAGLWGFPEILGAETPVLVDAIRPAGYYNTKARKLKEFAGWMVRDFDGSLEKLFALDVFEMRQKLLGVWGIGEETADDIVLYAANKPSFVIDKYTIRLVDRLGWRVDGRKYSDYQEMFAKFLPEDVPLWNEYHALIDGHAARVCKTRPKCDACCLQDICRTGTQVQGRRSEAPKMPEGSEGF